jgi:hypothetical protein
MKSIPSIDIRLRSNKCWIYWKLLVLVLYDNISLCKWFNNKSSCIKVIEAVFQHRFFFNYERKREWVFILLSGSFTLIRVGTSIFHRNAVKYFIRITCQYYRLPVLNHGCATAWPVSNLPKNDVQYTGDQNFTWLQFSHNVYVRVYKCKIQRSLK